MLKPHRPRAVHGPPLARLLADLNQGDLAQPRQSLSERLSLWLDWNHAVALSNALDATPTAAITAADLPTDDPCAHMRSLLTRNIVDDRAFTATGSANDVDGAFYRQRCQALQQKMEAAIAELRERLRRSLSSRDSAQSRLAAVDAVLERTLGRRERIALAKIPPLLEAQFKRMQARWSAHTDGPRTAETLDHELEAFRRAMQRLLLAELDLRLQPAEGLYAALRHLPLESHVQKTT